VCDLVRDDREQKDRHEQQEVRDSVQRRSGVWGERARLVGGVAGAKGTDRPKRSQSQATP
jgi:hypothetical protein